LPDFYWYVVAFFFGLCFGSFGNVVIYRLPLRKSLSKPPSTCPKCNARVKSRDLIPILSWLILKGKCRKCKVKISPQYAIVELICGLLFVLMVLLTTSASAVFLSLFVFLLLVISVIDWKTQTIPDSLIITGVIVGVLWVIIPLFLPNYFPLVPSWYMSVLGIIIGALPFLLIDKLTLLILKKDAFGYGDVKLMAMAGIFLGPADVLIASLFSLFIFLPFGVVTMLFNRKKGGTYVAYGPFLCGGILTSMFFAENFINLFIY